MSDPDSDLIPGLRAGNETALRALIDRRMASVHRVAYRLLGDSFEVEARILTWLCRVATNGCYDRLRRKRPDLPGDDLNPVDERTPVDHQIANDQRWDALQTAMMRLPDRQRTALSLCYDEAMPQREAASVMGIGQKAYEALLVRARRALRALMEETEHA